MNIATIKRYLKEIADALTGRASAVAKVKEENSSTILTELQTKIGAPYGYSSITTIVNTWIGTVAEQFTVNSTVCKKVFITAKHNNTGIITVGGSTVAKGKGIILKAGETIELDIDNVNKIYVVAEVNGEDASATYFN